MAKNKNRNRNKKRSDKKTASNETANDKQPASQATIALGVSSNSATGTATPTIQSYGGSSRLRTLFTSILPKAASPSSPTSRRDSVISSTWGGSKRDPKSKPSPEKVRWQQWRIRSRSWLPCRAFRWAYDFVTGFARAYWGPHQADLFLTFCLATGCVFAGYIALEMLLEIFKFVAAQGTDANCSIVYVTVPGPIITVSLIGATPSNPARGTYYFSIVNGTTEWLNSIVPPSRFSTLITKTSVVTPIISSLPTSDLLPSPPPYVVLPPYRLPAPPSSSSPLLANQPQSTLPSPVISINTATISTGLSTAVMNPPHAPPTILSNPAMPVTPSVLTTITTSRAPSGLPLTTTSGATAISTMVSSLSTPSAGPSPIPMSTSVTDPVLSITLGTVLLPTSTLLVGSPLVASSLISPSTRLTGSLATPKTSFGLSTLPSRSLTATLVGPFIPMPSNPLLSISSTSFLPISQPSSASSIVSSMSGFMSIQTETTAFRRSSSSMLVQDPGFTTRVIAYGETAVSFIFPSPDITTTVSYWTGVYPTVTGPLPLDLQTIPLTTRTIRQTPLSALPSFEVFSSRPSQFKTAGTVSPLAKRTEVAVSATVQAAVSEPTLCGEYGNFTLTFDDTVVGNNDNPLLVANGMNNPYHHLFYANGFTYVPDKWEPYPALSQPNVAIFLPLAGRLLPNSPFAGTLLPGELGAGPRASVNAYWFNAYSAYFGCALSGITPCTLRISGYRYDAVLKAEVVVVEQNVTIAACWGYIKCRLTQVFFNDQFRALSGIQFNAYTSGLGIPQVYMMDDLQMEWYNNTCSAGILRIGHR